VLIFLKLTIQILLLSESGAVAITGITTDFDMKQTLGRIQALQFKPMAQNAPDDIRQMSLTEKLPYVVVSILIPK
jgi:hypothetical protein